MWHSDCFRTCMIEALFDRESYQMAQAMMDQSMIKHQAIAANIANIETPGYKRIDIDPRNQLQFEELLKTGDLNQLNHFQHKVAEDHNTAVIRPDGNNVKLENELLSMNRNALEYEFLTKYMGSSFGKIKTAITGNTSGQ